MEQIICPDCQQKTVNLDNHECHVECDDCGTTCIRESSKCGVGFFCPNCDEDN